MAYLASEVITNAYYISNIVSREFETPTGPQMSNGLQTLNTILSDKTINSGLIPYTDKYTFTTTVGDGEYYIANLIGIDTITFFINDLRFQMTNQQRQKFFGSVRATSVESLPMAWHTEKILNGTNLFLYPLPSQAFPIEIWGDFRLSSVTQFQDLELTLDRFYINYLEFALAARLCMNYGYLLPIDAKTQLDSYEQWVRGEGKTLDLSMQKVSSLTANSGVNYALANLGNGWMPVND